MAVGRKKHVLDKSKQNPVIDTLYSYNCQWLQQLPEIHLSVKHQKL